MFLKKVYRHSKLLFLLMMLFAAGQLFINYKHGVVFSPFYHYGMYSEVIDVKPSYAAWQIEVNGHILKASDYSIQQWDMMMLPLQYFRGILANNEYYRQDVQRLLSKLQLAADKKNFLQSCNYQDFESWYKGYVQSIIQHKVSTLTIHRRSYRYDNYLLSPATADTLLPQLCI